ncbi:MAG: hypothetical protein F6K30_16680, partial [Cyanothece sp. SIO2G6]|nr:hypothetical protein [Cyanothece sp. SIO2G6]
VASLFEESSGVEPLDSIPDDSVASLFDEAPEVEPSNSSPDDSAAALFEESSEAEPLDSLKDDVGELASAFISAPSDDATSLFDQFGQAEADDPAASLFDDSQDTETLDGLQDEGAEQSEDTEFASLLEELEQDAPSSSEALSNVEEAKTLADLLRGQNAYIGQQPSELEAQESRSTPPTVPSDSDPFSNWFGSESEDMGDTEDSQKKNNG